MEVHNSEGAATNKQRLEVLQEQEELIADENKQEQSVKETTGAEIKVKDDVDLDEKEEAKGADAEMEAAGEINEVEEAPENKMQSETKKDNDTKS